MGRFNQTTPKCIMGLSNSFKTKNSNIDFGQNLLSDCAQIQCSLTYLILLLELTDSKYKQISMCMH